jgi:O-antigen/teichoic acid export membrane protein
MKYILILAITALFFAGNLQAYVGPGAGVGVIGAIVGVLLAVLMAILGIFWYPIKRMFKKDKSEKTLESEEQNEQQEAKPEQEEK